MIFTNDAKDTIGENERIQKQIDEIGNILENSNEYSYSKDELDKLATKLSHLEWELEQNNEYIQACIV